MPRWARAGAARAPAAVAPLGCLVDTNPNQGNLLDDAIAYVESIRSWVPGCSIAAVDLIAGVAGTYATGRADLTTQAPFTPSTIAIIDSVSKQFTALMLAQAVVGRLGRDGPMQLTDTIGSLFGPYVEHYSVGLLHPIVADITLRQLADYTSGLPGEPTNEDHDKPWTYTLPLMVDWLVGITGVEGQGGHGLVSQPGQVYDYSDVAVDLLGILLADQLTLPSSPGDPVFQTLVEQQLLGPLGMVDTSVSPPVTPQLATGYLYDHAACDATFKPANHINDPAPFSGGGGALRSTAEDMLLLLHALVDPPSTALLDRAVPFAARPSFPVTATTSTGLGWDPIFTANGRTVLFKDGGGAAGASALLGYSPDTKRALFFMANVDGAGANIDLGGFYKNVLSVASSPPTTTTAPSPSPSASTPSAGSAPTATPVPATPRLAG